MSLAKFCDNVIFLFLQFVAEFPSRLAPLLRIPSLVQMTPRERHAADMYMDELRELFEEWQAFRGHNP